MAINFEIYGLKKYLLIIADGFVHYRLNKEKNAHFATPRNIFFINFRRLLCYLINNFLLLL